MSKDQVFQENKNYRGKIEDYVPYHILKRYRESEQSKNSENSQSVNTKIRTELGWKPTYTFKEMMEEMTDHWLDYFSKK